MCMQLVYTGTYGAELLVYISNSHTGNVRGDT